MAEDFRPTASVEMLRRRSELTMAIHSFFQGQDFVHVETPLVSRDTVVDRHIEPVPLLRSSFTGSGLDDQPMWLQTSPEFLMKRLLASGMDSIYQICKAFRQGEQGARHNPEFTMLEWYRCGDGLQEGMQLLSDFTAAILDRSASKMVSYREAFVEHAQVDPFTESDKELARLCRAKIEIAERFSDDQPRDFWLDLILVYLIEPRLGVDAPTIIYDWPASQSALAIVRADEHPVAERFELYVDGVELANGYHELLDADELLKRNELVNQQRLADGNAALPEESRLLNAMRSGMPACAGVAVGVDRLLMVLSGSQSIADVVAFGFDES
jgi:lysyl-tRNA synthetase class 2